MALTREPPRPRTAAILLNQHAGLAAPASSPHCKENLDRGDTAASLEILNTAYRLIPLGGHLTIPWRVVIAGPVNVGKSSLVNALAGYG